MVSDFKFHLSPHGGNLTTRLYFYSTQPETKGRQRNRQEGRKEGGETERERKEEKNKS
jgi:hypothetical protein